MIGSESLLNVEGVSKTFMRKKKCIVALKSTTFQLEKGEILGVIGESGCGKSTLLKILTGLERPIDGRVMLLNRDITQLRGSGAQFIYRNIQMVFQHPEASFNPRRKMRTSILENMKRLRPSMTKEACNQEIEALLKRVKISPELIDRYPHQLSGGQCQRVAIVRALSVKPQILLCDEITSGLDVLVQDQVIEVLQELNKEFGITIVFVSHDLSLTCNFCKRVMVMYQGRCVECGTVDSIAREPKEAYTKTLLGASSDLATVLARRERYGDPMF